jgi:hypothetical protein
MTSIRTQTKAASIEAKLTEQFPNLDIAVYVDGVCIVVNAINPLTDDEVVEYMGDRVPNRQIVAEMHDDLYRLAAA